MHLITCNIIYIICLLDMFLESFISIDENRLSTSGFSTMRPILASNTCIWLHYIDHLTIIRRDNVSNLKNCLVQEISRKKRTMFPHMLI